MSSISIGASTALVRSESGPSNAGAPEPPQSVPPLHSQERTRALPFGAPLWARPRSSLNTETASAMPRNARVTGTASAALRDAQTRHAFIATQADRTAFRPAVRAMLEEYDRSQGMGERRTLEAPVTWLLLWAEQHAKDAVRRDPALAALPLEERMAVALYTRRGFLPLNAALSGESPMTDAIAVFARLLCSAINLLPEAADVPLFRGMNVPSTSGELQRFLERYQPGQIVVEPRFWSVSENQRVADNPAAFGGNVLISFAGAGRAKRLGALSPSAPHGEWLLACRSHLRVVSAEVQTDEDGRMRHHITLENLGSAGPPARCSEAGPSGR